MDGRVSFPMCPSSGHNRPYLLQSQVESQLSCGCIAKHRIDFVARAKRLDHALTCKAVMAAKQAGKEGQFIHALLSCEQNKLNAFKQGHSYILLQSEYRKKKIGA